MFDPQNMGATDAPRAVGGEGHPHGGTAAVAVPQGDDLLVPRDGFGQHDGRFIRIGARGGKKANLQIPRCNLSHFFGQIDVWFVGIKGR